MEYHSTTTLNEIRAHGPCRDGWEKLLSSLGKTKADDEPLHLLTILESNGLDDAIWCLRVSSLERLSRHFQAWCAGQVLHIYEAENTGDMRVRDQIAMLSNDAASASERNAAAMEASAAARAVRNAAASAAWSAADSTAVWNAAWTARTASASAAESAAAASAAWSAARKDQERQLRKMIGGVI